MSAPVRLDPEGRLWQWHGRTIDVGSAGCTAPIQDYDGLRLVGAAVLAHRDATTPDDLDAAALLVYLVEAHPPWGDHCPTCEVPVPCPEQRTGEQVALAYLIRKSTELVQRSRANVAAFDTRHPQVQPRCASTPQISEFSRR